MNDWEEILAGDEQDLEAARQRLRLAQQDVTSAEEQVALCEDRVRASRAIANAEEVEMEQS